MLSKSRQLMQADRRAEVEALIARVALNNQLAFSQLYDATSGKIFTVCLNILNEPSAAEDAMQEVYIKVWNSADRYQAKGYSPMTWLITIARNTAIDQLRQRKLNVDIADFYDRIPALGLSPEETAVVSSETKRIVQCFGKLKADHSDAVIGAYLQGKTYKELAVQFDVPLNTMRTQLRRSLLTLRDAMAQ